MFEVTPKPRKRVWLNNVTSGDNGWLKWDYGTGDHAELLVADCSRTIALSFSWWDKRGASERLKKLNLLELSIREFCEFGRQKIYKKYPELKPEGHED